VKLKEDDKAIVQKWLQDRCGNMRCHACGNGQWNLLDISTLQIGIDLHTTRFFYHGGIPFISISCVNCGYVMQFNPAVMGIKPDEPAKEEITTENE